MSTPLTMESLVALCKRRGFVYPSSEIYGGFSAVYDFGPYGVELKNNIAEAWRRAMIQQRSDMVGLDSAIFMHPMTWKASGHVDSFNDPQIDCRDCKNRMRADHLLEKFDIDADKMPVEQINAAVDALRAKGVKVACDKCGKTNLTPARQFSMMVKSNLGSPVDELTEESAVYLRAETCQGIYLNYKNVIDTVHPKLPFGIAQVGKAFRNEIVARQFVFRTRELEQMEMQYFIHPDMTEKVYEMWRETRWKWLLEYGVKEENLKWYKHAKLAHYAKNAYDILYNFTAFGGFKELEGIHARGDWDLSQHAKFSGERLDYFDETTGTRFVPHIVETAIGLGRAFVAFLHEAYTEEPLENGETRIVLKFDPRLAPIKAAVLPLQKKDGLADLASSFTMKLRKTGLMIEYDDSGSIGKRYRRQDEIGTPWCITVDYTTKEDQTVTIRHRDSMKQERVPMADIAAWLEKETRWVRS